MIVLGYLILQVAMLRPIDGQFGGGGGGGPSTFGYDGSSACSKPYSRNARARYEKLPCDFRRQNWCTVAGSAYPWHAVRRFVQENQGLMRRMYGDERHINVLKAELEKNDIEVEYEGRYRRYGDDETRRFRQEDAYDYANKIGNKRSTSVDDSDEDYESGRSYTGSRLNEPIRSGERETTSTTIPSAGESSTSPEPAIDRRESTPSTTTTTTTTTTAPSSTAISSSTTTTSTLPTERIESEVNSSTLTLVEKNVPETFVTSVTLADLATIKNSSINEIPGQSSLLSSQEDASGLADSPIDESASSAEAGPRTTTPSSPYSSSSAIDRIDHEDFGDPPAATATNNDHYFAGSGPQQQQQFRPRPEYRPGGEHEKPPPASSPHLEAQLFQDVAAKDHQQEQPILKLRGVNACPVKEEVVAPFWANNTRGEVLALLNLYPFEQYVHWEKCTHENKQMYCRDGCRCEQQYRLHRLLAYDPSNECRGIFSDWFKFPSCCVCRCYDLPVEFRVTSRSPRIVRKQKLKLRPPGQQDRA